MCKRQNDVYLASFCFIHIECKFSQKPMRLIWMVGGTIQDLLSHPHSFNQSEYKEFCPQGTIWDLLTTEFYQIII